MNENRDTIFVTDDNLDSNINSELNKQYKTQTLTHILHEHMTKNNIVLHNIVKKDKCSFPIP